MFHTDVLSFQEFKMSEPLPLSRIHNTVFDFLRDREDAVLFGAQAVNAYVPEPRMTQAIDLLSPRATELANELKQHLHERFHIAVRTRSVAEGRGVRLYQSSSSGNRHLVDLESVQVLPDSERIAGVLVIAVPELLARKVVTYHRRRGQPRSGTDWRDITELLLAFPDLKRSGGQVAERICALAPEPEGLETWQGIVALDLSGDEDDAT